MSSIRNLLAVAAILLLSGPGALAQSVPGGSPSPRPRVGVALSGGGARGAAHVGVLKVLDELRIPVDVVAGASMGAIVGGLYATGLSPQEMEDVLATMDWDDAFVDKVPRRDRPFRRKLDEANFLTKLVIGIENGHVALPSGLVQGQKLNFILRSLTLPSALVTDFDRLDIPYRATATDASTGEKVVLSRGNVAEAMRASMAFPGLFAPVELDGKLLVDGGVAENFPVQTAREAGAQVLVAVNIGTPLAGKEKLNSLLKIVNQVTNVATARNVAMSKAAIGPEDIFIEPDLGTITFLSFDRAREAAACGERAARLQVDKLRKLSVSEEEYRAWKEKTRRKPAPPTEISSVELVNPSPLSTEVLMRYVRSKPGPLDMKTLGEDLARLNAIGEFDLVDFQVVRKDGGNVLQIVLKDRTWGRTSARFGINLNTDLKANNAFELAATVTRTSVNRLGAEWRVLGGVGEITTLLGEFWQPLTTGGHFFVAPLAGYKLQNANAPTDAGTVEFRRKEWDVEGDVGVGDGKFAELRLGLRLGHLNADPIQDGAIPSESVGRGAVVARFELDSRDNVPFPGSGGAVRVEVDWQTPALGADYSTRRLSAGATWAGTWAKKNTIQLMASGGSPLGTDLPYYDGFSLGGFRKLSGYRPDELGGLYMAFAAVTYRREISRLPAVLGGGIYLGASLEAGNTWTRGADVSFSSLHPAGSLFVAADTPLGPLYLAAGLADGGHTALYLVLGYPF